MTIFLLQFIQERVLTSWMEILEEEKGQGERREEEEKTMVCASNVFLSFMNFPRGPNSDSDLSLPLSIEISLQPVHWLLQGESYFKSFYTANL